VLEESPQGADVVIETTGNNRMFAICRELIRPEGRICLQGYYPDPILVDFHPTHLKRPTVTFPCGWDAAEDSEIATDLGTGHLTLAPLITHRFDYRNAPSAYRLIVEHPEEILGLVFRWSQI
jgi:threonine dehydrogenase-like Zn-dependent dehydrogenase